MVGENQTPTLSSAIDQIVLNPRWYVSDRIRLELNAEAKSDPDYFTRHGYVEMTSLHSWGQPRIFQRSGPKNALGRVKFEFPNIYDVYLHDTPLKNLFQRSRRDFSHGCVRVDKALSLAEALLKDDNNAFVQKINSIMETDHPVYVRLAQPVPISIEYIPVSSTGGGQVVFLGDPYGLLNNGANQKG
jgi:murein L,D-transpeptidase YcbB/YkuD